MFLPLKNQLMLHLTTMLDIVAGTQSLPSACLPHFTKTRCCMQGVDTTLSPLCRDPVTGKPRTMSALLRTTGGDCSQAVARTLSGLFAAAGVPSAFHWDEGMWVLTAKKAGA